MSERQQAETEGKGYPVGSVSKDREGLTELTNFIDDLEPLDHLDAMPITTKPRVFTIDSALVDTKEHNIESDIEITTKFIASLEELEKFYSEPNSVASLFSNLGVLKDLNNTGLLKDLSDENKSDILGKGLIAFIKSVEQGLKVKEEENTSAVPTGNTELYKKILNAGSLRLLEGLKQNLAVFVAGSKGPDGETLQEPKRPDIIEKIYNELEEHEPDNIEDIKKFLDQNKLVKPDAIPNLEKLLAYYKRVVEVAKARSEDRRKQSAGPPEGQPERRKVSVIARANIFINKDNPTLTHIIEANTIPTKGSLGVYDYDAKAIITSNNAIFFKVKDDKVMSKNGPVDILVVYGTNGKKYALLPEQLQVEEKSTFSLPANVYVYLDYPDKLWRRIKNQESGGKPLDISNYPWKKQDGKTRWLLPTPTTVKRERSGHRAYSPSMGKDNQWWVEVRILSKNIPAEIPETVFVENSYLERQTQITGSLEMNDLEPGSQGNTSRSDDKASDMQIDQSSAGNEVPIQKARGLVPFKMPGYNDPSIAMSEEPDVEYEGKVTEYKKLAKRLEKVNSKIYAYLLNKISK